MCAHQEHSVSNKRKGWEILLRDDLVGITDALMNGTKDKGISFLKEVHVQRGRRGGKEMWRESIPFRQIWTP